MDQKSWLSRKRSLNKSISVNNEAEISVKGNQEEKFPYEKEATLEEIVKNLHQQVACLLCECNAKDKLVAEHLKTAQEANTGRERAEAEVAIQKQKLEDTSQQKAIAIKNFKQQLIHLKFEQDRRINLEKAYKKLESKYTESRRNLANLTVENSHLTKALLNKNKIIKNVNNQISEATSRFDSIKRGNEVLKYDYRRADVANLEAERQKLRLLVRKRISNHTNTKPKNVDKRINSMVKQLRELEEENGNLKESSLHKENENRFLEAKIIELEDKLVALKTEVECLKESKRMIEDLKLINYDLDQQLYSANLQIKEAFQNVSIVEMELEDRSHYCEGLEATCLELQLQLQLASISGKDKVMENLEERKLHQTGLEITSELTNNKKLTKNSSLRDHMAENNDILIKEIISNTRTEDECAKCNNNVVPRALPIVPCKKRVNCKGTELLRKLLFRRKRGCRFSKKYRWARG